MKAELRSNQKTMGGGGGEERRHHFFLFDLAGLYKYDLQNENFTQKTASYTG